MNIRRILSNIGWDGAFWAFCGLAAFSLGALDFLPQLQLTNDPILRLTLSSIGILLGAIVAQTANRRAEVLELKNLLGISESHLLDNSVETPQQLVINLLNAKRFVLDTRLNSAVPQFSTSYISLTGFYGEYHRLLYQRVSKGELVFRQVEIIFHQQSLQLAIFRLLLYESHKFYLRHYEPPPNAIPMIHMLSFDDETFYLGGFYTATGEGAATAQRLQIREPNLNQLLKNYWNVLWSGAIPLNEGRVIDWAELKRIGLRIGLSADEFDRMVTKIKEEVQREKRKYRLK